MSYGNLSPCYKAFVSTLNDVQIAKDIQEALQQPEWKTIVLEEMRALEKNGTWVITNSTKERNPVSYKWISTVKHTTDGSISRFKA